MSVVSKIIVDWPSDIPFCVKSAVCQQEYINLPSHVKVQLAIHEYLDRTDRGEAIDVSAFARSFADIETAVLEKLSVLQMGNRVEERFRWPKPGDIFDGMLLEKIIGYGAMSRVFIAIQPYVGNRRVVLKVARTSTQEFSELAKIHHYAVTEVLSVHYDGEMKLFGCCQRFFSEWTLADFTLGHPLLEQPQCLPWDLAASEYFEHARRIMSDVLSGIAASHRIGVLHNDIKPQNILVSDALRGMLIDFNSCSRMAEIPLGCHLGTLPYLAPELIYQLAQGSQLIEPTVKSDIYSLGATFFELLTGTSWIEPLVCSKKAVTKSELLCTLQHCRDRANTYGSQKVEFLDRVGYSKALMQALDPHPSNRFESVEEFASELLGSFVQGTTAGADSSAKGLRLLGRRAAPWIAAAGIVACTKWEFVNGTLEGRTQPIARTPHRPEDLSEFHHGLPLRSQVGDLSHSLCHAIVNRNYPVAIHAIEHDGSELPKGVRAALRAYLKGLNDSDWEYVISESRIALSSGCVTVATLNNLAYAYLKRREIANAKIVLDKVIESNPDAYQPYWHRAFVELAEGRSEVDLTYILEAVSRSNGEYSTIKMARISLSHVEASGGTKNELYLLLKNRIASFGDRVSRNPSPAMYEPMMCPVSLPSGGKGE